MCGISGAVGPIQFDLEKATSVQHHRGPDNLGVFENPEDAVVLIHNRLSIIDLSAEANQPFADVSGRYRIIFNGEVYNYIELRNKLNYSFRTKSDTEVVLAAFIQWGPRCLDEFIGMFSFVVWDAQEKILFAARDRFGVKPFYYAMRGKAFVFGSEIKSIFSFGSPMTFDVRTWATYLNKGLYDHAEFTFWDGVYKLLPGHHLTFSESRGLQITRWYDFPEIIFNREPDRRTENEILEELRHLLKDAVALRFRSDVPVGVFLSGGLDSASLYGIMKSLFGDVSDINTFTFYSETPAYDERPWVEKIIGNPGARNHFCELRIDDVPRLSADVFKSQEEPFGGFPTLAFSLLHREARHAHVPVLLDGNGIDEGWAGYDYYERPETVETGRGPVQATTSRFLLSECLRSEFSANERPNDFNFKSRDKLEALQCRDIVFSKIPRAMRFADRVSMMYSNELREPFLDHRILELGLVQPRSNKIRNGMGKFMVRRAVEGLIKEEVANAPKRPVQTPQREWLREGLKDWVAEHISNIHRSHAKEWFDLQQLEKFWSYYKDSGVDNSFPIWQLISLSLAIDYGRKGS
jgi:asparagine synthase (glutamine-hydrolysing)